MEKIRKLHADEKEANKQEISELKAIQPKMHIVLMSSEINHRDEIAAILFGAKAFCSLDIASRVPCSRSREGVRELELI